MSEALKNRYQWVMLALSFSIAFLLHLLNICLAPMVNGIMSEWGLSYTEFGLIFSVAVLSLMIFRIPWGLLGDRIGYQNSFRIALPGIAVLAVIRALSPGYVAFLASHFLLGVGLAVVMPCLPLIVKEWAPERPGFATGLYISGFAAGNATALGLTPWLLEQLSWRHILLAYSGLAIILALLWWAFARSDVRPTSGFQLQSFVLVLKDRYVWVLLLLMMACVGGYDTLAIWLPKILDVKGLAPTLATLLSLGFFLAGPTVGLISDRFRNAKAVVALLGIIAGMVIVGINYAPFPLLLPAIFVAGFATIGVLTIILSVPTQHQRLAPAAASVVGIVSSLGNLTSLLMPAVFGYLIDLTGTFQASLFATAAVVVIMFVVGSRMSE